MRITVINGSMRHGSTWRCKEEFLKALAKYGETKVTQFMLPKDMPNFCRGCFSCFYKGEDTCPDAQLTAPIVKSLEESDVIVITSPVYALAVSGQLKALFDHLCFMWLSHRPSPAMFDKTGVIFTTTAGMGAGAAAKTIKSSMSFWGVKRIFVFKKAVSAMRWDDIKDKKKANILKTTANMAKKATRAVERKEKLSHRLTFRFMFGLMKGAQKKNDWNLCDRNHWEEQGWLSGKSPFRR